MMLKNLPILFAVSLVFVGYMACSVTADAVSYTHLTLPTILLV